MRRKLLPILFVVLGITLFSVFLFRAGELPQVVASDPAKPMAVATQTLIKPDFVFGDPLPDAPKLAYRGVTTDIIPAGLVYSVGVRTLAMINPNQIDILKYSTSNTHPLYDRPITVEVWYPAVIPPGVEERVVYSEVLGISGDPARPNVPFTFEGRALRDADPFTTTGAPFPLVIVSHGYPGSRYMMTYLDENLASKGYVVVAIDHTDSTFEDVPGFFPGFQSTLLNRPLDQLFVLDQMGQMNAITTSFLYGLVDADHTAIVGYSMGGYGALNSAGAGINISSPLQSFVPGGYLSLRSEGNPTYTASLDPRLKAIVAFAPWGQGTLGPFVLQAWTPSALANIKIPSLFVVGSQDDVALYNQGGRGVASIFSNTINSNRYMLVYQNALHNVAPNPPPQESWGKWFDAYARYSEPAWNNARINNINQHFVTAFLGMVLKGQPYSSYLIMVQNSNDGVGPTYWKGFIARTALGMEMHRKQSGALWLPLIFKDWQLH